MIEDEVVYFGIDEMMVVESMFECKVKMMELVDVFIVLFGGVGILDEIIEVYM